MMKDVNVFKKTKNVREKNFSLTPQTIILDCLPRRGADQAHRRSCSWQSQPSIQRVVAEWIFGSGYRTDAHRHCL